MQKQEFGASYAYPRREGSTHGIQVDVVRADSGMESRASATVAEFQIWSRFEARSDTSRFSVSPVGPTYIDDSLPSLLAWHATPNMTSVVIQPQHSKTHEPVLVHELVDALVTDQSGSYLDATFGRGGHARAILAQLSSNGRLIGFDRDLEATSTAHELEQTDSRFMFSRASFSQINSVLAAHHIQNLSGICLDVGVSTPQLMNPDRGFSFDRDGPLDMRMDTTSGSPASLWLNKVPAEELAKVLRLYGDVRAAKSIARHIASRRPLKTTFDLVAAIRAASGSSVRSVRILAQVFQAVRIYINDELNELEEGLEQGFESLAIGGRLAVISFHSLEHRLVRNVIHSWIRPAVPRGLPIRDEQPKARHFAKNVRPSYTERQSNSSSRSAMMQVVERLR